MSECVSVCLSVCVNGVDTWKWCLCMSVRMYTHIGMSTFAYESFNMYILILNIHIVLNLFVLNYEVVKAVF